MEDVHDTSDEKLRTYLNNWLDGMMEVYGDILQEWDENNIIKPRENCKAQFKCNNCGKCCDFSDHWVWVYPSDIVSWLKKLNKEEIIPLFLGILFPVQDQEGNIGYGLPSQATIWDKFRDLIRINQKKPEIRDTFQFLLDFLQDFNPGFNKMSNYCIFYNPNREKHCLIHQYRPVQCKSYPYDFPQFCKIDIPEELSEKYGAFPDDMEDLPACPLETFSSDPTKGVKINEEQIAWVLMEKANYLASTVTQKYHKEDISDILLELFHEQIKDMERKTKFKKDRKGKMSKFVAGKRPNN